MFEIFKYGLLIFPFITSLWLFIKKAGYKWEYLIYLTICIFVWIITFESYIPSYKEAKVYASASFFNFLVPLIILILTINKFAKKPQNEDKFNIAKLTLEKYLLGVKSIASSSPAWFIFVTFYGCLYFLVLWNLIITGLDSIVRYGGYKYDYMFRFFYRLDLSLFWWFVIFSILNFMIIGAVKINNKQDNK